MCACSDSFEMTACTVADVGQPADLPEPAWVRPHCCMDTHPWRLQAATQAALLLPDCCCHTHTHTHTHTHRLSHHYGQSCWLLVPTQLLLVQENLPPLEVHGSGQAPVRRFQLTTKGGPALYWAFLERVSTSL